MTEVLEEIGLFTNLQMTHRGSKNLSIRQELHIYKKEQLSFNFAQPVSCAQIPLR